MAIELIHQLFEEQVNRTPEVVAVVMGKKEINYRQLNQRANQVAHFLIQKRISADQLVGISMDRSIDMVVVLLGILKAGGAYLPMDPDYPQTNLQYIAKDAKPVIVLTDKNQLSFYASEIKVLNIKTLEDEITREPDFNPEVKITSANLAYCIYTSGSTGRPKGVLVEHRSVVNFLQSAVVDYGMKSNDRMLQFASLNFDTSVEEIYPPLISGAALVLRQPDMTGSIQRFLQECALQEISILDLPTAFWHELVMHLDSTREALPKFLRLIIIGGERVSPDMLQIWHRLNQNSVRLDNTYGLTECTCVSVRCELTPQERRSNKRREVAIGRAIENVNLYILTENLKPVSQKTPGELYIGGGNLARGYLNLPDLTRERFLKDPFAGGSARMYKTGDLVLKRTDGSLEYLGRNDDQIKIRGFRIEPGEVETVILELKKVRQAAVIKRTDPSGNDHLIAYLVMHSGQTISREDLWQNLVKKLPAHLIPAFFIFVNELPLLPNNKIDKKSLPDPNWESLTASALARPSNETESMLLEIWEETFGRKGFGVDDDFFEIGGNSILAARMATLLERKIYNPVPMALLVETQTIRGLAKLLTERGWKPGWQTLVPMRSGGKKPPLFLVHAIWGDILSYRQLVNHIHDNDQPVYGIRARGFDGIEVPFTNLESMATYYLDEIMKVQPTGPYFLGGYSFGGTVAYEMAQQLVAQGEQVALLAMFDTVIMDSVLPELLPTKLNKFADEIARYFLGATRWMRISNEKKFEFLDYACKVAKDWLLARISGKRFVSPGEIEGKERISAMPDLYRKVHEAGAIALHSYTAIPYPGRVTLFDARDRIWSDLINPVPFWQKLAMGGVTRILCSGKHYSFLDEPHVSDLAEKLEAVLHELNSFLCKEN